MKPGLLYECENVLGLVKICSRHVGGTAALFPLPTPLPIQLLG